MREENILLKATVAEADKSRELIMREVSNVKELEADRIREVEQQKNAEVRMQEKII